MDMKVLPRLRAGIGQGYYVEAETPKLVVRIRSGPDVRRGSFVGDEKRPIAFIWADEEPVVPAVELVVQAARSGSYVLQGKAPVELAKLFPNDRQMARVEKRLSEWQGYFERHYKPKTPNLFYWGRFHEEGIKLARQLQVVLIDRAVIRYFRPEQDPQFPFVPELPL